MRSRPRILPLIALGLSSALAVWTICTTDVPYGWEPWDALLALLGLFALALAAPLAGAAVWFLFRKLARRLHIDSVSVRAPSRIFPDTPIQNVTRWKPQRLAPVTVNLPNLGQFFGFTLNILMFVLMLFEMPRIPTGLMIPMTLPNPGSRLNAPPTETLGVYVGRQNQFYINGEAVPRDQLREKLRTELAKRVVWTVYVEADDDVAFGNVVVVFDTIEGLGAQPYWITPRDRETWKK